MQVTKIINTYLIQISLIGNAMYQRNEIFNTIIIWLGFNYQKTIRMFSQNAAKSFPRPSGPVSGSFHGLGPQYAA